MNGWCRYILREKNLLQKHQTFEKVETHFLFMRTRKRLPRTGNFNFLANSGLN